MSLEERFFAKTTPEPNSGCLLWTAADDGHGYGVMRYGADRDFRLVHASRVAWEIAHGAPPPDDALVLHTCDLRACVEEKHLYLGDQAQNMRDAVERDRLQRGDRHYTHRAPHLIRKGEAHPCAKLTADQVAALRAEQGLTQVQLAVKYGISQAHVWRIKHGARWA